MSSLIDNRRQPIATTIRRSSARSNLLIGGLAIALGVVGGATVAFGPLWLGFVVLVAFALGYAILINIRVSLALIVMIATVLPFGTLPFKAGITPNFLELALLALFIIWLLRLLIQPDTTLVLTPLGLPLIGFWSITLFALVLGSSGHPDSLTLHNYFKFTLAIFFFFSIVNCVRTPEQTRFMLRLLIIGGALSALVGLVLFALPDNTALQMLTALGRIGYPTTGRVLRYVEDDPNGIERAIGFGVDPNSFGGMLALIGALSVTQAVCERPVLPRKLLYGMAGVLALVTFLTQSRGALGGLVIGTLYVTVLRYRKLLWPMLGAAILIVVMYIVFGIGASFVERVTEGAQFADQANQMRLNEFQNAIAIIQRYPLFGIGFGSQGPDIDLGVGVSSIYLALAERTGLIGLFAFLGLMVAFFMRGVRAMQAAFTTSAGTERGAALLSLQAAIVAALAVGTLDHYFFNIEFSHMVALFWGCFGLSLAVETTDEQLQTNDEPLSSIASPTVFGSGRSSEGIH